MTNQVLKIFIAAMGPGEIGQGVAFAKYAIKNGANVTFAVFNSDYLPMVELNIKNFNILLLEQKFTSLNIAITQCKPDALVLCNSKIFNGDGNPPMSKPPTISIDSNWLFNPDGPFKSLPWVDIYCVNIPQEVFKLGLRQYGGDYNIPADVMKKIKIIGLLPSYPKISQSSIKKTRDKYGILTDEKLVFVYASTASLSLLVQTQIFNKAISSVKELRLNGYKIKIVNVGSIPQSILDIKEEWLINLNNKDALEFYKILSSADLVFQHQGLGTLAQSISANIPVIANVKDLKDEEDPRHAHAWEVLPFERFGACSMFYFSDDLPAISKEIKKLLYDNEAITKMKKQQSQLYSNGEKNVLSEIELLVKRSRNDGLSS